MAKKPVVVEPETILEDKRSLVERLLILETENEELFSEIATIKEKLRKHSIEDNTGFTERFDNLGYVTVSKPSESKFKGIMPTLDVKVFLAMNPKQRQALIDKGLITMEEQYTKKSAPSVTVKVIKG